MAAAETTDLNSLGSLLEHITVIREGQARISERLGQISAARQARPEAPSASAATPTGALGDRVADAAAAGTLPLPDDVEATLRRLTHTREALGAGLQLLTESRERHLALRDSANDELRRVLAGIGPRNSHMNVSAGDASSSRKG
eukprot:gnl/TRDRNA2_/TRDRNA2_192915_c0_seq1.p1 gnl/TRDRNA2_/TRDRNA2_192915_c0~~gnl/TRDRNA2_/TRDRNA2_192915_c0_seq1.p1  ORF type:complete len:144 (+),score=18.10 gnl/TRDRNA2_/TRDRNA2_192915_c0_seq1:99-530(+)